MFHRGDAVVDFGGGQEDGSQINVLPLKYLCAESGRDV